MHLWLTAGGPVFTVLLINIVDATAFRLDCEYTKLVTPLLEFVYQVYSGWVGEGGGGKGGGGTQY